MNVVFYNRNFTGKLPLPKGTKVTVSRYSKEMIGGPGKAVLSIAPTSDRFDMRKLLRCPVEIEGKNGNVVWYGFVNRVNIPIGETQRAGIGLDELYNYVIVSYSGADTAAASDTASVTEYGQKEIKINDTNATQTEGEQRRDLYLLDHQAPPMEIDLSGGSQEVAVECYGWYGTLGWKYYADADTTNTENTTQITNIVTAAGQFLQGTLVKDTAGITSNEYREGNSSALTSINQLLNAGTSNVRPLLAYVDPDRYLRVYERPAEPPLDVVQYVMRSDGRLENNRGVLEPDENCRVAVWARLKEFSDFPPFFIERAEYDAIADKTTYTPAGAFEQIRLAKYIINTVGGISGSGSSTSSIPYTPTIPTSYSTMRYMMVAGIAANRAGVGNTDQTWVVPVTASSGAIGTITTNYIAIYVTGYYAIIARADAWAASAGSGDFNISWFTAASRGGSFISDYGDYIDDGNADNEGAMCIFRQITAGTHIYSNLEKVNGTGSIQGGTFETLILKLG